MINQFIQTKNNSELLCRTILGLERETMRTTAKGNLSNTPHPESLGSAMNHPLIKTDFCEAQVEYATKSSYRLESVLRSLDHLHNYTVHNIPNDELLWPFSMPPRLPNDEDDIPLAVYGESRDAVKKTVYRRGLGKRYGRRMQTISGVHINISFSKILMNWASEERYNKPLSMETQTQLYLDTIRNFNRYSFLMIYLFGSSPAMDVSFSPQTKLLKPWKNSTWISEHATSIRLSELGYTSQVQNNLKIRFNSIDEYLEDLGYAISTTYPPYSEFNNQDQFPDSLDGFKNWNQLNDYYLQIENEYYSLIRPKQIPYENERPLESMKKRGIRYLEVRCVDTDPFSSSGVSRDTIAFNQLFLLFCLLKKSPFMDEEEKRNWDTNQSTVVWHGRDPNSQYTVLGEKKDLQSWFMEIYPELETIALFWDNRESCNVNKSTLYIESLLSQIKKIKNMDETPSSKVLNLLKSKDLDYMDLGLGLAQSYKIGWLEKPLESRTMNKLNLMRKESLNE